MGPGHSWLSALVVVAMASSSQAAVDEMVVTIRTYNYAKFPDQQLLEARGTADRIFKRAGITLRWLDCRLGQADDPMKAPCVDPLREREDLLLKLSDSPRPSTGNPSRIVALGTSMLDPERRGGVLMAVDLSPIRAIADSTPTDLPTLVGRAIAHEMGHMLLGRSEHPKVGLMRALWAHDELRGTKPSSWEFSSVEAAQMRSALRNRSGAAD